MKTERIVWTANGLLSLGLIFLLAYLVWLNYLHKEYGFISLFLLLIVVLLAGLTKVKPNEAKVVLLFGKYLGTVRHEGLIYTVPFTKRKRVSLKIKTFEGQFTLELAGRPIQAKLIIFYKIVDTAKVLFEVDQFEEVIQLQSETILRAVVHQCDHDRLKDLENLSSQLQAILEEKLARLGIEILDTYLSL